MIDKSLLEIIACPVCQGKLKYQKKNKELICVFDKLAFPIEQEIPIMLVEEARQLKLDEVLK